MKKNLLLVVSFSLVSFLVMGQKKSMLMSADKIEEFKNRVYLSTSDDPLALLKVKKLQSNEIEAQRLVSACPIHKNTLKSAEIPGAYVDTTHTYPWNAETQDWDTIPTTRIIKYYDDHHNLVHYIDYIWNSDTKSWQENIQFFYKYNEADQQINALQQSWRFDEINKYYWSNIGNATTEYDSLGLKAKYNYKYWNYELNDWDNSWEQSFSYDSLGNNISIIEIWWDPWANEWTPGLKTINQYDSNGHVTSNPIMAWNYDINDWMYAFKYSYEYNSLGNNTGMLLQTWNFDESLWENALLKTISYNGSNQIDNYLFQSWDPFLYEWYDTQRGIYKYDSQGNNICILGEDYDQNTNTWNSTWASYYEYNEQNKRISEASLYWNSGLASWTSGSKTKNAKIKKNVEYLNEKPLISELKVYPNPTADFINVQNKNAIEAIQIFNTTGNVILSYQYSGLSDIQVDISELKSGTYFLKVIGFDKSSYLKRFIKL